jgi:lactoylglutathione lyase
MKIEHIAIWVKDIEKSKEFYTKYFQAVPSEKYLNPTKKFTSYFLTFESGARLELMHKPEIANGTSNRLNTEQLGFVHIAISVGSKENVDKLTAHIRESGHTVHGNPRTTGDGYYESVILDPEGNRIEITI